MNEFKAAITIYGKIECITGLHIGGSDGGYEIGGMENAVIRNAVDGYPYIPGSSLKGKMRSMMEWAERKVTQQGKDEKGKPLEAGRVYWSKDADDEISRIFGAPAEANRQAGPTRLIVRDAKPDQNTRQLMNRLREEQGLPFVEIKTEVNINRITSAPLSGPRQMERVPVGSKFDFEMVYAIYDVDGLQKKDADLIEMVFTALRLVEDSALGGSGSRGYGQVRFEIGEPIVRTLSDYQNVEPLAEPKREALTLLREFDVKSFQQTVKEKIGEQSQ